MKVLITTCLLVLCSGFFQTVSGETRELTIAVQDVFIPEVVDQNTDAKIVLSGMFPNSCYRWSRATVRTPEHSLHEIQAKAFVTVDTMCLMVIVPFTKEVNLGRLSVGEHTLRFISGDETYFERKLIVQ